VLLVAGADTDPRTEAVTTSVAVEVIEGLSRGQKTVSPKFFYDQRGSRLFDEITRLPEYYVTSTELEILREHGGEMASCFAGDAALIELGIGSAEKARRLLDHLPDLKWYVPVDISESALDRATRELRDAYPELDIRPICADFTRPLTLAGLHDVSQRVLFYPGSTIGNLDPDGAATFLERLRHTHLRSGDGLLLGGDMQKDVAVIEHSFQTALSDADAAQVASYIEQIEASSNLTPLPAGAQLTNEVIP